MRCEESLQVQRASGDLTFFALSVPFLRLFFRVRWLPICFGFRGVAGTANFRQVARTMATMLKEPSVRRLTIDDAA